MAAPWLWQQPPQVGAPGRVLALGWMRDSVSDSPIVEAQKKYLVD